MFEIDIFSWFVVNNVICVYCLPLLHRVYKKVESRNRRKLFNLEIIV